MDSRRIAEAAARGLVAVVERADCPGALRSTSQSTPPSSGLVGEPGAYVGTVASYAGLSVERNARAARPHTPALLSIDAPFLRIAGLP
jgi:hypothetical protein